MIQIIIGAAVFGVTLFAAIWRWKKYREGEWLFLWLLAVAAGLWQLATVN